MAGELRYVVFRAPVGWLGVLGSRKGLLATTLPQSSSERALNQLGDDIDQAAPSSAEFKDLMTRLEGYLNGHRVAFDDVLDPRGATAFQRRVWQAARLIPYGETRSYAWVAQKIGRPSAVRAVGQALANNPWPIIVPCHRVVNNDGRLGGYSGGVAMKQYLLNLEASAKSAK